MAKRHRPGSEWRVKVCPWYGKGEMRGERIDFSSADYEQATEFDEVVIDKWLHAEQMNDTQWWMNVGGLHVNVTVGQNGQASHVHIELVDPDPKTIYRLGTEDLQGGA